MKKSGLADSPFFRANSSPDKSGDGSPIPLDPPKQKEKETTPKEKSKTATMKPSNRDTMTPRYQDTTVSRVDDAIIEVVRKAVKEFGKEAATHRFTPEEKREIAEIVYAYKTKGVKTSENEITRIAVNFILSDFNEKGKKSILEKALAALND